MRKENGERERERRLWGGERQRRTEDGRGEEERMRGEILGKKVMGDNIQKMVALFQPGSLTLPVSSPRVSSSSSSSRSGSDTPLVLRRRRPFGKNCKF